MRAALHANLVDVDGRVLVDAVQPDGVLATAMRRDGHGGAHALLFGRRQVQQPAEETRPVVVRHGACWVAILLTPAGGRRRITGPRLPAGKQRVAGTAENDAWAMRRKT